MRYGAQFAEHFAAAEGYGWRPGTPPLDWAALVDARDRENRSPERRRHEDARECGVETFFARGRITGDIRSR